MAATESRVLYMYTVPRFEKSYRSGIRCSEGDQMMYVYLGGAGRSGDALKTIQ